MNSFLINGESIPLHLLSELAQDRASQNLPEWEKDIYRFVVDWMDETPYISQQTSGSTGVPKIIKLNKDSMRKSAQMTATHFGLSTGASALLCLPVGYIAGKMMLVRALVNGWNLWYVAPSSNPLEQIDMPFEFCAMVPLQVHNSLENNTVIFNNINKIIIGGAPIPNTTRSLIDTAANACFATYGMTETITHIATQKINGSNAQEYFHALPQVSFEQDERKCLVIKAPHLDAQVVTNDLVDLISSHQFKWLGRIDNVINSGGIKIIPEQVEQKLQPYVVDRFYVVGAPDPQLGERLVLKIESDSYSPEKLNILQERLTEVLSRFERPKAIQFVSKFTETGSGKVKRV